MKKAFIFFGLILSILSLMFFANSQENMDTKERFKHYKPISKKETIIKVMYLTWDNKNLPNYIKLEDYERFIEKEKLIQYCFYMDSKNPKSTQFNKTIRDNFKKKIPVEITGKFYITKRFDNYYPNQLFEELRRVNELGFESIDKDFTVFVID